MKVLFVVQRYGERVAGGAEALARMFAERLVPRGHQVAVLTTCATDYRTWADDGPPGTTVEAGVSVHRLHVPRPRDPARFASVSARVFSPARRPCAAVEQAWMAEQGPVPEAYESRLRGLALDHDLVVFMTYLYATTTLGVPVVAGLRPTVLYPTAHDEVPFRLPLVRGNVDRVTGIACSTVEESDLVALRFRPVAPRRVIGIGFDPPPVGDAGRFRARFGLGDDPYVLVLGRVDPNKGSDEAISHVLRYRTDRNSPVRLVLMGMAAMDVPDDPGVTVTGFVDDGTRWDALDGAAALLQPSYQESFSMALAEAWQAGRPAVVQGRCAVLDGLARRAGAALPYRSYAEFAAGLDLLLDPDGPGARLGAAGRAYVADELSWTPVLERFESLLAASVAEFERRRAQGRRATSR